MKLKVTSALQVLDHTYGYILVNGSIKVKILSKLLNSKGNVRSSRDSHVK